MDKYRLAKLVQWAGADGVIGRKRLQKVVYFLQKAGCSFGAEYTLHHYGPYSRDVAEACDELVTAQLLEEEEGPLGSVTQYTYKMAERGQAALDQTERRPENPAQSMAPFRALGEELLRTDLWELELGSTILYFRDKSMDWNDAARRACEFKKVDPVTCSALPAAKELARKARRG